MRREEEDFHEEGIFIGGEATEEVTGMDNQLAASLPPPLPSLSICKLCFVSINQNFARPEAVIKTATVINRSKIGSEGLDSTPTPTTRSQSVSRSPYCNVMS